MHIKKSVLLFCPPIKQPSAKGTLNFRGVGGVDVRLFSQDFDNHYMIVYSLLVIQDGQWFFKKYQSHKFLDIFH